jgi:phosphoenolpyruvate carboxylase
VTAGSTSGLRDGGRIDEAVVRQVAPRGIPAPRAALRRRDEVEDRSAIRATSSLPVIPALYQRWDRARGVPRVPGAVLDRGDRDGNPSVTAGSPAPRSPKPRGGCIISTASMLGATSISTMHAPVDDVV